MMCWRSRATFRLIYFIKQYPHHHHHGGAWLQWLCLNSIHPPSHFLSEGIGPNGNWYHVILEDAAWLGRPQIVSPASWQTCCRCKTQHLAAHQNTLVIWDFGLWTLKLPETTAAKNRLRVNFYTKASYQPCTTREVCPGKELPTSRSLLFYAH